MKRLIILILFFAFLISSFLFATTLTTNDITVKNSVYSVYSDHYAGLRVINWGQTPLTDDGFLWNQQNAGSFVSSTESWEGNNVLSYLPLITMSAYGFTYNDADHGVTGRYKDMSVYKYMMISFKSLRDSLNRNQALILGLDYQGGHPTDSFFVTLLKEPAGTTGEIHLQDAQFNKWNTLVISTSSLKALLEGPPGFDMDFSKTNNFVLQSKYGTFYMDNWVFFKELPSDIVFSTINPTVNADVPFLISVDAIDSTGRLSAMPPPKWTVTGGPSGATVTCVKTTNGYAANFQANMAGTYTLTVSTGVWDSEASGGAGAWHNFSSATPLTITVTAPPDWKSTLKVYSDYVHTGNLGVTKNSKSTVSLATISNAKQGTKAIDMDCNLVPQTVGGTDCWGGLFIEEAASRDLTTFGTAVSGVLSFYIKTDVDVEIAIKSDNLGDNHLAKINISDVGVSPDINNWQLVQIPLKDFKTLEVNLDFSKIVIPFAANVVDVVGTSNVMFDDIKWISTGVAPAVVFGSTIKNNSNRNVTNTMSWQVDVLPNEWIVSDQHVEMDLCDYDINADWGLQIYTDNAALYSGDKNSAGLVKEDVSGKTKDSPLSMAWLITKDRYSIVNDKVNLAVVENTSVSSNEVYLSTATGVTYYPWQWIVDKNSTDFENGATSINIYDTSKGAHHASGDTNYSGMPDKFYMYIAADFANAQSVSTYKTNLVLERYTE